MNPRLKSSRRWTSFPPEYEDIILELFKKEFAPSLGNPEFFFEGRIYPSELTLTVGYLPAKTITQNNFEVSAEYDSQKENVLSKIHTCVDCIASILSQYIKEHLELPREWQSINFENQQLYFRYHTENTKLEEAASRLLQEAGNSALVYENKESDDLLDREESLNQERVINETGENKDNATVDLLQPTMLSGKKSKKPIH